MVEALGAAPGLGCGDGRAGIAVGRAERPAIPVAPHGLCDPRPVDAGRGRSAARRIVCVAGRLSLALALLVGSAAMAVLRPAAGPGGAPLVMARGSGALFVRVGEDLRPVANMASARLILNEPAQPRVVDDDRLGPVSSGPVLGIPGAPQRIGEPIASGDAPWTVCDGADGTTTVAVGSLEMPRHWRGAPVFSWPRRKARWCTCCTTAGVPPSIPPIRSSRALCTSTGPSAAGLFDTADSCPRGAAHHRAAHRRGRGVSLVGGRTVGSVLMGGPRRHRGVLRRAARWIATHRRPDCGPDPLRRPARRDRDHHRRSGSGGGQSAGRHPALGELPRSAAHARCTRR